MSYRVKLKIVIVKIGCHVIAELFCSPKYLKNIVSILSVSCINTDICDDRIH